MKQLIIKIKSSQGGLGKADGAELAPGVIVKYLDESFEIDEVEIIQSNIEETNKNIEEKALQVLDRKPIFLGGDHSITFPLFKAFAKKYKSPCLLIFDAHVDMSNDFLPPTHEDFNKTLIEQNIISPKDIMIVGARKIYDVEKEYIKEKNIQILEKPDLEKIKEFVKDKDVYLSIDFDVLDPNEAPGTGYLEKDGLKTDELIKILAQIKPKAVDIVEINPKKDLNNMTSKLGAKLIVKLSK
jgi:agmatinase|tara:strand:- start:126 stop:848 length:723 start_codon:yes stop_codon:yes gene_type:complete